MNKQQMEMLSVKSAIERTVQGYIATYQTLASDRDRLDRFYDVVERYVASLFASGQIDNNHLVRSTDRGVDISFSTQGQYTKISFHLPECLIWRAEKVIKQVASNPVKVTWPQIGYKTTINPKTFEYAIEATLRAEKTSPVSYDMTVDLEEFMGIQKDVIVTPPILDAFEGGEQALRAYDIAKKAVE